MAQEQDVQEEPQVAPFFFACAASVRNGGRCDQYIPEQGGFCDEHKQEVEQAQVPDIILLRIPILWDKEKLKRSISVVQPDWEQRRRNAETKKRVSVTKQSISNVSLGQLPAELASHGFRLTRYQLEPGVQQDSLYFIVYFSTVPQFETVTLTKRAQKLLVGFLDKPINGLRVFVDERRANGLVYHTIVGHPKKGKSTNARRILYLNNGLWGVEQNQNRGE